MDDTRDPFEAHRPLLFSIAYRMMGSATEAEDILQDAYLRYQSTQETITYPKAFLSTVVTRLCLNRLQSAQAQREHYVGTWLPEPLLTNTTDEPAQQAELRDSISLAFLTLLEQLTPDERAVLLLREVFDYDYAEIAAMVGKAESACRQLLSRAKKHLAAQRPRFKPTPEAHRKLLESFIAAIGKGELEGLAALLAEDVVLWADGGKVRGAIAQPLHGPKAVARFLLASTRFTTEVVQIEFAEVNGEQSIILRVGETPLTVLALEAERGLIRAIRAIANPDKLKWITR